MNNLNDSNDLNDLNVLNNLNISEKMNQINKIIYNLDQYSNGYNFGQYFENYNDNLRGGTVDEENNLITIKLKKYNKIKTFAKVAKNTIIKYRNYPNIILNLITMFYLII